MLARGIFGEIRSGGALPSAGIAAVKEATALGRIKIRRSALFFYYFF